MENKKTKLTISGDPKKSFKNIDSAKNQGKKTVIINRQSSKFLGKGKFSKGSGFKSTSTNYKKIDNFKTNFKINNLNPGISDFEKRKLAEQRATKRLKDEVKNMIDLMNRQDLNTYVKKVVDFSFESNKYFNDSEPWSLKTKDPERMNAILHTILEQIKNISILLNPIIPISTKKVLDTINLSDKDISIDNIKKDFVKLCKLFFQGYFGLSDKYEKFEND